MNSRRPTLSLAYLGHAPSSAARVLDEVEPAEVAAFLTDCPVRLAAPVVVAMSPWNAASSVSLMEADSAAAILRRLAFHDAAGLLRLVPAERHGRILEGLPARLARRLSNSLDYATASVGAWLDPEVASFAASARCREGIRYLRDKEGASHVFVNDEQGRFVGAIAANVLLRGGPESALGDLAIEQIEPLSSRASLNTVAFDPLWDRHLVLPVVGRRGSLVGGLSREGLRRGLSDRREAGREALTLGLPADLLGAYVQVLAGLVKLVLRSPSSGAVRAAPEDHAHG